MLIQNPLDFNRWEALNLRLQNLAAAPASPVVGQEYFDTTLQQPGIYTSGGWLYYGPGSGTVTGVLVATANGLAGTSNGNAASPTLTLSCTVTGLLKANGSVISAAAAGTDYLAPNGSGAGLTALNGSAVNSGTVGAAYLPALNGLTAPTGPVAMNGQRVTGLGTPTAGTDAATKQYVDIAIQGMSQKPTATVATLGPLPACTYSNGTSGVGATLTATANAALTVDGYAVAAGDEVLVKNQAAGAQNGLYTCTQAGTGSLPFILTRNPEMDTAGEFAGAFIPVEDAGASNQNSLWLCTNSAAPTVGTTAIAFVQLNKGTDLSPGTGVGISGNVVSVAPAYAGNGIGTVAGLAKGDGAGTITAATAADLRALGAVGRYTALLGNGSATSFTITQATHQLAATGGLVVQVFLASDGSLQIVNTAVNSSNGTVTVTFGTAPAANQFRVVIVG